MNAPPDEGEHDAGGADDQEHPAPAQAEHEERKQGDGDEVAEGRGGLQQAGGETALANAEPIAHHAGAAGEERGFADTECKARGDEGAEAVDEAAGGLGEGPAKESEAEEAARAVAIDEAADGKLRDRVGPEEGGEQQAHFGDRDSELVLNEFVGHGQGGAIDIIQRAAGDEEGDGPALNRNDPSRRLRNFGVNTG